MEHSPNKGDWVVVSEDEYSVTMVAMCSCGEDCAFSLTADKRNMVRQSNLAD